MSGMVPDSVCVQVPPPRRRQGRVQRPADFVGALGQILDHPLALVAAQAVGLWPMGQWYGRRVADGSDEPWGLLALVTVLLLVWGQRGSLRREPQPAPLLGAGMLTVLCAISILWLPPLARAVLGVSALALTLAAIRDRSWPLLPLWALLLLSMPVASSLQFYLGYPLRALTAWTSSGLLNIVGLEVERTGTTLYWMGRTWLVDAPCSGIRMLWVGMFLAALLSHATRASTARFALNATVAFLVILAGNVLRNTLLFVMEAGILPLPAWTHAATGLLAFLLIALLIAGFVRRRPYAR